MSAARVEKGGKHFWSEFWNESYKKAIIPLLLIVVAVTVVESFGWFQHLESVGLDSFARGTKHEVSTKVLVVEITDEDYKKLFASHSPLAPNTLIKLVDAIRQNRPKAIGVDVDTEDVAWRSVKIDPAKYPDVVWAQVPVESDEKLQFAPVLGGKLVNPLQMGVVRLPQDGDGVIRKYRTHYDITGSIPSCAPAEACRGKDEPAAQQLGMDAFFRVLARRYNPQAKLSDAEESLFKFSGDRYAFRTLQASEFLDKDAKGNVFARTLEPDASRVVAESVVLVGGAYGAARDEYMTPLGKMQGVELLANAVESDLSGGIRRAGFFPLKAMDLVLGSVIVLIYFVFRERPGVALAASVASILVLPALVGMVSYFGAALWLNFAPVMAGMLIHQMYEGTEQLGEMHKEVRELKEELAKYKEPAQVAVPRIETGNIKAAVVAPEKRLAAATGQAELGFLVADDGAKNIAPEAGSELAKGQTAGT